ncbi:hypothetical protein [Microcoleus sp. N9_A1]|uniref:hypothetical protein n=1 Tax=Microcoleus sp. N9_A1 TaxID=3055380 RepID=UPI002FD07C68
MHCKNWCSNSWENQTNRWKCGDRISTLFQGEMSSIEEGVEADGYQILNTIGVLPTSSFHQGEEKFEFICTLRGAIAPECPDGFPKLE